MKVVKILGVILLLAATITAFTMLNAVTVTITSKGQAKVESQENNTVVWKCEPISQNDCTITIEMLQPKG